ncbi:MAG: Asp-tRNA(Asn)/Glu-tRNA(Gln) amidotransferase GatCAB subunit A, partial [Thermus sp.]
MLAHELLRAVREGRLHPRAVAEAYLERARRHAHLGAFLTLNENLLQEAEKVDREAPLAGLPVAIKDNLVTKGLPTTAGSRLLEGFLAPYEATAVRRLREAGALILGKTNLDEFAMGS